MFSALQQPFKESLNRPLWHIKMTTQEFPYDENLKQILVSVISFSDDVTATLNSYLQLLGIWSSLF